MRIVTILVVLALTGGCGKLVKSTSTIEQLIAGLDVSAAPAAQCDNPSQEARNAIVRVSTLAGGDGSGVVVAKGFVLTAYHVVEDTLNASVNVAGRWRIAHVVGVNLDEDLAILSVNTGAVVPLPVRTGEIVPREIVWAMGYPEARELDEAKGYVNRLYDEVRAGSTSIIDFGHSGGGIVACNGDLVGFIRSIGYWHRRSTNEFISTSQPIFVRPTIIRRFLAEHQISI